MNNEFLGRRRFPDTIRVGPDDMGLSALKQTINAAQYEVARKFDDVLADFISGIEGCDITLPLHSEFVAAHGFSLQIINGDHSYFIWNSPTFGVRVLAYRFSTGFHNNDSTCAVTCEMGFESGELPRERWPEGLRKFLEGAK